MSMFNWFSKKESDKVNTNFYKVSDNELIPIERNEGNGSVNSMIEQLGYLKSQVFVVLTHKSKVFQFIAVRIFTRDVVFVLCKDNGIKPSIKILKKELEAIDWDFEYSINTPNDILTAGIGELTLDYLKSVVELKSDGGSVYHAPRLELYLSFEKQKLVSCGSSEWAQDSAKWLRDVNKKLYDRMLNEALQYHDTEVEAMEEINLQCDALQSIPNAVQNSFVPFHEKSNGTINFYNLLAAHYNPDTTLQEFIVVNKGRYVSVNSNELAVNGFVYRFDGSGKLVQATRK